MERLVILPFSAGCISEASVAVGVPHPRRSKPAETNSPHDAISLFLSLLLRYQQSYITYANFYHYNNSLH
jgi:hypothetical protein